MEPTVEKECIVCGDLMWWDDSPLPVACREHTYSEVLDALEAAENEAQDSAYDPCDVLADYPGTPVSEKEG